MTADKIQTGLRLEIGTWKKVCFIAKKNKRSLNAQMEFLAQECIEKYEREQGKIPIDRED